jgi:hypothetical protein
MELENIILSEVSQVQKPKVSCFLSHVENRPNKNKSNIYKYILIYTEHVSKSGTGGGDQRRRKRRK